MLAEKSGGYSLNVYIFILNNSQPQVSSGYCATVSEHGMLAFLIKPVKSLNQFSNTLLLPGSSTASENQSSEERLKENTRQT